MKAQRIMSIQLLLSIMLVVGFSSCSKKSNSNNTSRATGWKMDGKKKSNKKQLAGPGLVFVEGGTFTMGRVQDDVMHDWNNTPTQEHVQSFYMDETEVTNSMYLDYLDYIKEFTLQLMIITKIFMEVPCQIHWFGEIDWVIMRL